MKRKMMAVLLATITVLSLAACGSGGTDKKTEPAATEGQEQDQGQGGAQVSGTPLEILTGIWDTYGEDEKFAIGGGDYNEDNMAMDAPGKVDPSGEDYMDATLAIPADAAAYVDDAASAVHMMNANSFTAGAFHIADASNADTFISDVDEAIKTREWMCGFPEKLLIAKLDDSNIIMAFGAEDLVGMFKDKVKGIYADAEFAVDRNVE